MTDPRAALIGGLVTLGLAAAWWGFKVAKRRTWAKAVRKNAVRAMEAEDTESAADDAAEETIRRELEKGPGD